MASEAAQQSQAPQTPQQSLTPVPETAGDKHTHPCPTHTAPQYTSAGYYSRARHLHVELPVAGQALERDQQLPKGERAG